MLIPVLIFGQGIFKNYVINDAGTTTGTFYIKGTARDTSEVITSWPLMTFKYWAGDTTRTGTDSVSLKIYIDHASLNTRADWLVSDSISITSDSTWTRYIYTDKARPTEPFMRVRVAGQAANKKLAYTKLIFIGAGWHSQR